MKYLDAAALVLVIVGALNWALVGLFEFDLVAWIFGEDFGSTNIASRIVYVLVGLAGLYLLVALLPALLRNGLDRPYGGGRREMATR